MFGKSKPVERLAPPPRAASNPSAVEILTGWAAPGSPQQLALRTAWKNPAAWGLLIVDIARHAARAYASEGHNEADVLRRIREGFDAEWSHPTE